MRSFYSPLRYPGGKNCNFSFVSELIKENGLIGCKYIEPYAGGAGLALRLLYEEYVSEIILNDYDPLVYAFWKTCQIKPQELIEWVENVPINIDSWFFYREILKNADVHKEFDLAKAFLFLNRTNISGIIRGGVIGGIEQLGKYKIDARFNRKTISNRILKFSKFSNRITILNLDCIDFLNSIDKEDNDSLIYLDPPYYQKGANLYLNFYKEEDHVELAKLIPSISCNWLLSYDNCSFIKDLYNNFEVYSYDLNHSTSNKIGKELIVLDRNLSNRNSLNLLKNLNEIKCYVS
ncbi:DNA adenine methylase [uncultured Psychrobacter sp.]|uniref:DNA adenine methylase n=1 Tax=uncultured Psychrobacter sp. TaxID=259303 RepID=UPI0025958FC2|nr:DNA adenine methylase [uncultured Psychrobacter sp.]